jgi:DNA-binding NarL/FixJ family response regulator
MDPRKSALKVALVDKNAARRLRWINAFRDQFNVVIVPFGKDPVRIVRDHGVGLLIVVQTDSKRDSLRIVRGAKTERRPALVGVMNLDNSGISRADAESVDADGYISGSPSLSDVLEWVSGIQRGERPMIGEGKRGLRSKAKQALGLSNPKE